MIRVTILSLLLYLDSFIVMMEKGATLINLKFIQALKYSLIFGAISALMFSVGKVLTGSVLGIIISRKILFIIGGLALLGEGAVFLGHSIRGRKEFFEKADPHFNYKQCAKIALLTSIDMAIAGLAFGCVYPDISILTICLFFFVIGFITVMIALKIGYSYGAKFQTGLELIEGIGVILFAFIAMLVGVFKW